VTTDGDVYEDDHKTDWRELEGLHLSDTDHQRWLPLPPGHEPTVSVDPSLAVELLRFSVRDAPAPQGSKHGRPIYRGKGADREFTGKVAQVESSKKVGPWREAVRGEAVRALSRQGVTTPFDVPIWVEVTFTVRRPKKHFLPANSRRPEPVLRDDAPDYPTGRTGDLDKLERAVMDALTAAGVWPDDSVVVDMTSRKRYPGTHPHALPVPGAHIRIWYRVKG
jgi:Holliday junction resolvase RusA-like endonuclease